MWGGGEGGRVEDAATERVCHPPEPTARVLPEHSSSYLPVSIRPY